MSENEDIFKIAYFVIDAVTRILWVYHRNFLQYVFYQNIPLTIPVSVY